MNSPEPGRACDRSRDLQTARTMYSSPGGDSLAITIWDMFLE